MKLLPYLPLMILLFVPARFMLLWRRSIWKPMRIVARKGYLKAWNNGLIAIC